jgi:rhodanese-related sulfurtransferase
MKRSFRPWRQAMWMILVATLLGLLVNELRSDRISLFADWSIEARLADNPGEFKLLNLEEAEKLFSSKQAVFIDARSPEDYRRGHILWAQNLPWETMEAHMDEIAAEIPLEQTIIVYCDGEDCMLSEYVARELFYWGYDHVKVLVNGWTKWLEAGLPIGPQSGDDEKING